MPGPTSEQTAASAGSGASKSRRLIVADQRMAARSAGRSHPVIWYLVAMGLALTLPLVALSGYLVWRFATAERAALEQRARDTTHEILNAVDRELNRRVSTLETLAASPALLAENWSAFREQAALAAPPHGAFIVLETVDGRQIVNTLRSTVTGLSAGDAPLPQTLFASDAPVVGNLLTSVEGGHRFAVAVPVKVGDGVRYMLAMVQDVAVLHEILVEGALPSPYTSSLVDRDGLILARSSGDGDLIGKAVPDFGRRSRGSAGSWNGANVEGVEIVGTFARSRLSGWTVTTGVTQAALSAPLRKSLGLLAAIAAGLMFLGIAFALVLARTVAASALNIAGMAHELGAGVAVTDRPLRVREARVIADRLLKTSADLRAHARALAQSQAELAAANAALESRVAERTRELEESERRYRLIAETTSDIVIKGTLDDSRTYISPSIKRILGYEPSEILSRRPGDLLHPDDVRRHHDAVASLSAKTPFAVATVRVLHRDGHWVWVEAAFQLGSDGATVVTSMRDVSERERVASELLAAKTAAEAANRAKSEFLATMSHEMRTPLTAILGFARILLEREDLSRDARRQVDLVRTAGRSLLTVINDVLDLSKIEAGRMALVEGPFRIADTLAALEAIVRPTAAAKGLSLVVESDVDADLILRGDEGRLRQILLNYLNNAVKFTPAGEIALRCRTAGVGAASRRIRFEVADTGIGIAPDDQDRLFERFSQVESSTSREFGGTGLGLSICRTLASLMGGSVGVISRKGDGAVFWCEIEFPVARDARETATVLLSHDGSALAGCVILVVDDGDMNREIARAILEKAGAVVHEAADGQGAIAACRGRAFDLVLMDIQMPGMDGLDTTSAVRALGGPHASVPIIALTANVLSDQLLRLRQAGMNGHVAKPFEPDAFVATVRDVVRPAAIPANVSSNVLDRGRFDQLVGLLGPESVRTYLAEFRENLLRQNVGIGATVQSEDRMRWVHTTISQAGMMGFVSLAEACAAVEDAVRSGIDVEGTAIALKAAIGETLAAIDTIAITAPPDPAARQGPASVNHGVISKVQNR